MFSGLVCWVLWHINLGRPLRSKFRLYILNLRFPDEYLVDDIPNEPEPTYIHVDSLVQFSDCDSFDAYKNF